MKAKILLSFLLFSASITGFSTTWTIHNSGFTFTPDTVTINEGDSVNFAIATMHDAREVSEVSWQANGNTALPGGFQTILGGGLVLPAHLTVGTHWYVCSIHAASGMKGVIIVKNTNGVSDFLPQFNLSIYPNPARSTFTIKSSGISSGTLYYISDQSGSLKMTGRLNDDTTSVNIEKLASGIYILRVGDQSTNTLKVIKE